MWELRSNEAIRDISKGQNLLLTLTSLFERKYDMSNENELVYKSVRFSAVVSIVLGIIAVTVGLVSGVMLLISAGRLMKAKSRIMF